MRVCRWEQRGVSLPALFFLPDCLPPSHSAPVGDVSGLGHSRCGDTSFSIWFFTGGRKQPWSTEVPFGTEFTPRALEDGDEIRQKLSVLGR